LSLLPKLILGFGCGFARFWTYCQTSLFTDCSQYSDILLLRLACNRNSALGDWMGILPWTKYEHCIIYAVYIITMETYQFFFWKIWIPLYCEEVGSRMSKGLKTFKSYMYKMKSLWIISIKSFFSINIRILYMYQYMWVLNEAE